MHVYLVIVKHTTQIAQVYLATVKHTTQTAQVLSLGKSWVGTNKLGNFTPHSVQGQSAFLFLLFRVLMGILLLLKGNV